MRILGYNKTTLLDYPGHVATTLFVGGCNMRCPFCHNRDLVLYPMEQPQIPEEEIFAFLKKRQGILEGVCITGGEPTLYPELVDFIRKVKELGYLVKLDTNGTNPEMIALLLQEHLLDYIAMDVKSSKEGYKEACGREEIDLAKIEESVILMKRSGISHEFRTTAVKGIHRKEDFEKIGEWLSEGESWYLQSYKDSDGVIMPGFEAFSKEELEEFLAVVQSYGTKGSLRGVE